MNKSVRFISICVILFKFFSENLNADDYSLLPTLIEEPKETPLIKQAAQLIVEPEKTEQEESVALQPEVPPKEEEPPQHAFLPRVAKESIIPACFFDRSWSSRYLPPAIQQFSLSEQRPAAKAPFQWLRKHTLETSFFQDWLLPFFRADWLYDDIHLPSLSAKSLDLSPTANVDQLLAIREESLQLLTLFDPSSFFSEWVFPFVKGAWLPEEIRERAESPAAIANAKDKFRRFALAFIKGDWIELPSQTPTFVLEYHARAKAIEQEPFLYLKELTLRFVKGSWLPEEIREVAKAPEVQEGVRQKVRRYSLYFARGDWIDSLLPYLAVNFSIALHQPQPILASSDLASSEEPSIPSLAPTGKPVRLYLPNAEVKKFAFALFEQKKQAYLLAKQSMPPKPEPAPSVKTVPGTRLAKVKTSNTEPPSQTPVALETPIAQASLPQPELPPQPIEAPVAQTPVSQTTPEAPIAQATPPTQTPPAQTTPETPVVQMEPPKRKSRGLFIPPTFSETTPHVTVSLFDLFSKKAQPAPPPPPPPKRSRWPLPKRLELRHIVGFEQCKDCAFTYGSNYTAIAMMVAPEYKPGHFLPILDFRGMRFDNVSYASSIGLIARYIPDSETFCHMLGANVYWDYREGSVGYFNQIGLGIEILSRRWDIRANGYIPVGPRHRIHKCIFDDYFGPYYVIDVQNEYVSFGFNAEAGYYFIRGKDFLLYGAAGPYFIAGRQFHQNTFGGMVRLKPMYRDFAAVDLVFSHDPLFNNIWQIEFSVNLPLYELSKTNRPPCGLKNQQIYQPVQRFEVMPLSRCDCWFKNY